MKFTYKKFINIYCGLLLLLIVCNCGGFYKPATMNLRIPDGPPEFQAGWHDGCNSALATSGFQNARFTSINMGSGIYQHDPVYQLAYGKALFSCASQAGNFRSHPMFSAPLE